MAKCRICDEEITGNKLECEECWYFYYRAKKKFQEKRDIEIVGFDDAVELAKYIRELYIDNKHCAYTGLELMLGDRAKEERLKDLRKIDPLHLNEKEKRELTDLEQYKRTLNALAISMDRSISQFGDVKSPYSRENIVLCIRTINIMKGEFSPDEFIQSCYQVLAYQVEEQTYYGEQVLAMLRNFNARHIDKAIIPKRDQILKEAGMYEDDFKPYREEYEKEINKKHKRKK